MNDKSVECRAFSSVESFARNNNIKCVFNSKIWNICSRFFHSMASVGKGSNLFAFLSFYVLRQKKKSNLYQFSISFKINCDIRREFSHTISYQFDLLFLVSTTRSSALAYFARHINFLLNTSNLVDLR